MDGLYDQVVNGISANRNLPVEQVKAACQDVLTRGPLPSSTKTDTLV